MSGRKKSVLGSSFLARCDIAPSDVLEVVSIGSGITLSTQTRGGGVHLKRAKVKQLHAYLGRYLERTEKGAKR